MGCDIHMYAEQLKNDKWKKVGKIFNDPYYSKDRELSEWNQPFTDHPYSGRNYNMFAILADVRNGIGFAGIETGKPFFPLDSPRGLPHNISKELLKESGKWGSDGHSHSYFTVAEILKAIPKWKKLTHIQYAVVDEIEYGQFKNTGRPRSWSDDVGGRKISNAEMESMPKNPGYSYYTKIQWKEPYYESMEWFVENSIPQLVALDPNPENVRIVFWFDN